LVNRVYGYAVGQAASGSAAPVMPYFGTQFAQQGFKLPNLLRAIALSKAFTTVTSAPPPALARVDAGERPGVQP
jgi:hypothetical protein